MTRENWKKRGQPMTDRDGVVMPEPLAYFLTWATYGTWLPGDGRGWVERDHGIQLPDLPLELEAAARMSEDACRLGSAERRLVERTIDEHCRLRDWELYAVNCRSNHVHVVVAAGPHPDEVRRQLKAWTARKLGGRLQSGARRKWWGERGSRRYLNDSASLEAAILYVLEGQDRRER